MLNVLATTTPIDGGATAEALDSVKSFITTVVAPALFAVVLAGVAIAVGAKWIKKGANKA